ncbi:MAG: hypothetical protein M1833_002384 [Piccolia ochrophora]|nr:MAG: hypothetical protein M1833_002384 [Piccolia ochrophora]
MSAQFASANPFRRKTPGADGLGLDAGVNTGEDRSRSLKENGEYDCNETLDSLVRAQLTLFADPPSKSKRVRVASPPVPVVSKTSAQQRTPTPQSDDISQSSSPPSSDAASLGSPELDPFQPESEDEDGSVEDEELRRNTRQNQSISSGVDPVPSRNPPNPFRQVEETQAEQLDASSTAPSGPSALPTPSTAPPTSAAKASLDVEAFKRLMLTGNASKSSSNSLPTPSQSSTHAALGGDGGSSTDASSISRQSIFEPVVEAQTETPRSSHEIVLSDDERTKLVGKRASAGGRKKPPPPRTRHGKLIKDKPQQEGMSSPPRRFQTQSETHHHAQNHQEAVNPPRSPQTPTNLNKELPPPPVPALTDIGRDRDRSNSKGDAGEVEESSPSPSLSSQRKQPPAPPLARRHSQLVASKPSVTRHDSLKASSQLEDEPEGTTTKSKAQIARPSARSTRANTVIRIFSKDLENVFQRKYRTAFTTVVWDNGAPSTASTETSGLESRQRRSIFILPRAQIRPPKPPQNTASAEVRDLLADLTNLQREVDASVANLKQAQRASKVDPSES